MIRFMQQRAGRRARISAVASRLLTEEGDLTGRRLPRIDWLEPVGYRQKAREETAQLLKSSRKSRAEAADHDVWDPEAQWAHFLRRDVAADGARSRRGRADVPADGAGARRDDARGARDRGQAQRAVQWQRALG